MPKKSAELEFFSGKVQVVDKAKNKEEWVYFTSAARYPSQLRMDVSLGLLGIPVGVLGLDGQSATLLSYMEKKAYVSKRGDQVLEKLLKAPISTYDIVALFAERFPLGKAWDCGGPDNKKRCVQGAIQIDWEKTEDNNRRMVIESPKSRVTFVYAEAKSGKAEFSLQVPNSYQVVEL